MGVVSRARNAKIKLTIRDVLRAKSIVNLAELAKSLPASTGPQTQSEEQVEQPFALSPIQAMYLKSAVQYEDNARFNQSFTLGVGRHVTIGAVKKAIASIVQRHPMLRARFSRAQGNRWEQKIAEVSLQSCPLLPQGFAE